MTQNKWWQSSLKHYLKWGFPRKMVTGCLPVPLRPLTGTTIYLAGKQALIFWFCRMASLPSTAASTPLAAAYGKGYWNPYLSNLSIKIIYSNNFLLYHDLAILVKFCHPRCFQSHHCFWDGFVHDELAIGHIVVTECFIRYWLILIKLWWHFLSVLQKVASYRGQGRRKGDFSAATWFLKPGKVDWQ